MEISDDIEALGAGIVWVHTDDLDHSVGTAERCIELLDTIKGPKAGWCVGDDGTLPEAGTFRTSKWANPGYDLVVDRVTMNVELIATHGAGPRNQNMSAEELQQEIQRIVRELRSQRSE